MKANELRIGNFIIESLSFGSDKVIKVDPNIFNRRIDEFIPITLTEEWLLKFGFKKWGNNDAPRTISYEFKGWSVFPPNSSCNFQDGFGFMWYKPIKDENIESARVIVKHVHQLQNLYFALTNEELEINN